MRVKFVLLVSLIASMFATGIAVAIITASFGVLNFARIGSRDGITSVFAFGLCLPPSALALIAGIFVYRHTARRRKLQAGLAAVLVLLLCAVEFTLLIFFMSVGD